MKRTLLLTLLLAAPLFGQEATGRFAPGQTYREPERNAPPAISRMFVKKVEGHDVDLPATGGSGMIILLPSRASGTLRTPTGDVLSSNDRGSSARGMQRVALDATQDVIHVDRTEAGRYHVTNLGVGGVIVASEPESRLTMTTTVGPLSRMSGQPVTLHVTLRDSDEAITGAHVVAHLTAPGGGADEELTLRETNSGEYERVLDELPSKSAGFWTVRYDADGTTLHGVEFARSGSNEFMNERASARLHSVRVKRDAESLHVSAIADVAIAGRYRFDAIAASPRDANGERQGLGWGESEQTLNVGSTLLELDLPVSEENVFTDVRLLSLDTMGVASRVTIAPARERFER